MKPKYLKFGMNFRYIALFAAISSLAFQCTISASEMGVPSLNPKKAIQKKAVIDVPFHGKLDATAFTSSVSGQSNEWRAVLKQEGSAVRVALKTGLWERPDPEQVSQIWLAYPTDFVKVRTGSRDLRFTYTFGGSTNSTRCIFKFGSSKDTMHSPEGGYSLSLVYGGTECTFSVDGQTTSGELPFTVTGGTTVEIRIKDNKYTDVYINDLPVLADQIVELDQNYITIFAINDELTAPHMIHLSSLEVDLARPKD